MNQAIGENFVVHLNKKSSTLLLFIIVLSLVKIELCKSVFSEPFSVPGGLLFFFLEIFCSKQEANFGCPR